MLQNRVMHHNTFSVRWRLLVCCIAQVSLLTKWVARTLCTSGAVLQNQCSIFMWTFVFQNKFFFSNLLWQCSTIVIFCSTSAKNIVNESPANFVSTTWRRSGIRCVNCMLDKLVCETWCLVSLGIQFEGTETYSVSINEMVIQGPVKWNQ